MSATFLGLLAALVKFVEFFLQTRSANLENKRNGDAILTLREYRENLERALRARRESRARHNSVGALRDDADSLPDDGYRRD